MDELLKDCNFRDFVQLIPTITHRLKLRKKYNDYVRFTFISLKFRNIQIFYADYNILFIVIFFLEFKI